MPADLLFGLLFVVTVLASYWFLMSWWPNRGERRLRELRETRPRHPLAATESRLASWLARLHSLLLRIGHWRVPDRTDTSTDPPASASARTQSLRMLLLNAGIPSPQAVAMFQALQVLVALVMPLCMAAGLWWTRPALQHASVVILLVLAAMVGYILPQAVLQQRIRHRQAVLFKGFPDALDLMRMCIQAGLGLDATLERVGREIRLSCPPLSQELAMTGYELRAGASRAQALRHLADRVALPDVEAWVNTLIQSDRFGTSISESLQVYAQALRHKRKLIAQEAAAKLPIKLLIPLVFCLFPGLLTVLLGPAVINIMTHLMPVLSGAR